MRYPALPRISTASNPAVLARTAASANRSWTPGISASSRARGTSPVKVDRTAEAEKGFFPPIMALWVYRPAW